MKNEYQKPIGPVPVTIPEDAREFECSQEVDKPFVVNRDSPHQQKLAEMMGWEALECIARAEQKAWEEMWFIN